MKCNIISDSVVLMSVTISIYVLSLPQSFMGHIFSVYFLYPWTQKLNNYGDYTILQTNGFIERRTDYTLQDRRGIENLFKICLLCIFAEFYV